MNENAKKWVEYLRSGIYKQTTGKLRGEEGFCCLGVACDLYGKEKGVKWEVGVEGRRDSGEYEFMGADQSLPDAVRRWLGLRQGLGEYTDSTLTTKNDSGVTFSKIADIIESEPEGLFIAQGKS